MCLGLVLRLVSGFIGLFGVMAMVCVCFIGGLTILFVCCLFEVMGGVFGSGCLGFGWLLGLVGGWLL